MASMPQSRDIEKHSMLWFKQQDQTICLLQETYLTEQNKHWLRVKGWKKVFQANESHKQPGVAILISDKVDFRLKSVKREK
jgi:exonuclease III